MEITFEIHYNTVWGEALYLTGTGDRLGNTDESKSLRMEYSGDGYWRYTLQLPSDTAAFRYGYIVKNSGSVVRREWGGLRPFEPSAGVRRYRCCDRWADHPHNQSYYSSAFTEGVLFRSHRSVTPEPVEAGQVMFQVAAPMIYPDQVLAMVGEPDALGAWNVERAIPMNDYAFPYWTLALPANCLPDRFAYKFVILDRETRRLIAWETGEDRIFSGHLSLPDEYICYSGLRFMNPSKRWQGAGVAIPVFSLRSEEGMGVGEFPDLKKMVDWAVQTGLKFIQILPINDTTMGGTWQDSYPYNANSTFALHPQYLRLSEIAQLENRADRDRFDRLRDELNALPQIDYERVNRVKTEYLQLLFEQVGEKTLGSAGYKEFFEQNKTWLQPYAAFCVLRDEYHTADYTCWGEYARYDAVRIADLCAPWSARYKEISKIYFTQYHLHRQLSEVRDYAHRRGVVLKGDIPIGISRTSADAWQYPELFRLDSQAGAPPDDFSVLGQNWGFPTYNWDRMSRDGYAWWKSRFRKMAEYFDAYRIDHILGFFRIWEIPDHAIHGLLGHFNPALPFTPRELADYGLQLDVERYARPYITDTLLAELFGEQADEVCATCLEQADDGIYRFKPEFDTQRKIAAYYRDRDDAATLRIVAGLQQLHDEVLFVEDPVKRGMYHPRISGAKTEVYRTLSPGQRIAYDRMHDDFFYFRHNEYWKREALEKLPPLTSSTRMLVCGEDLGMIPLCVPEVMEQLQILSLEIQRMPKQFGYEFGKPEEYPYLSVATTSTHDMSGIRGWWEENAESTQHFYTSVLDCKGKAPGVCEPWICARIVEEHLASPSMLVILPWQDWMSIDETLRRENPVEERINVPANSRHYWRYRMHLTLERLLDESRFNSRILRLVKESGR